MNWDLVTTDKFDSKRTQGKQRDKCLNVACGLIGKCTQTWSKTVVIVWYGEPRMPTRFHESCDNDGEGTKAAYHKCKKMSSLFGYIIRRKQASCEDWKILWKER